MRPAIFALLIASCCPAYAGNTLAFGPYIGTATYNLGTAKVSLHNPTPNEMTASVRCSFYREGEFMRRITKGDIKVCAVSSRVVEVEGPRWADRAECSGRFD